MRLAFLLRDQDFESKKPGERIWNVQVTTRAVVWSVGICRNQVSLEFVEGKMSNYLNSGLTQ